MMLALLRKNVGSIGRCLWAQDLISLEIAVRGMFVLSSSA